MNRYSYSFWRVRPACLASILLHGLFGLSLTCSIALAQPVPDRDTLLILQFDQSADADYAKGTPSVDVRATMTDAQGGRFGGGVYVGASDRITIVGNDGNLRPDEGTIELWIKFAWSGNDDRRHGLLSCQMGEGEYININSLGKGRLGIAIAAGQGDQWTWRRADGDISDWTPDSWHHVAFSWGKDATGQGRLRIFLDGHESMDQVADAQMPGNPPESIVISGLDGTIDALRILGRMVTAEDVTRSIQQALEPPYRLVSEMPNRVTGEVGVNGRTLLRDVTIPLILGAKEYLRGFACEPGAVIEIDLDRPYRLFRAMIGVCPLSAPEQSCSFEVWGDDRKLFDSGPRTMQQSPEEIAVPIDSVSRLRLAVIGHGIRPKSTWGIWAAAVALAEQETDVLSTARELKPVVIDMYRRQQNADQFTFPSDANRRFFVAPKCWVDDIDPSKVPARQNGACRLEAAATPGEFEPVGFVVYACQDLPNVRVEVSDLTCGTSVIPHRCIDVRLVLRRLMRDVYTLPPERSTVVSRFLLANQPLDVPAGTFREWHLIVQVPQDAVPGRYRGSVRLMEEARSGSELPLVFDVLPIQLLPLREKSHGVYYRFPATEREWSGIGVELADIRAHGGTMIKGNLGVEYETVEQVVTPSYDRLRRALDLLREHGFHGPMPVDTGCEQAARLLDYDPVRDASDQAARDRFRALVKTAMTGLVALARDYPEFEFLATHMDEVFGRDRLDRYMQFTEAVRQVPSLRVYITLHNDPKRDISDMMQRCDPFVDVRCYNGHCMDSWIRAGHTFDELANDLDAAGDEAWIYHNIRGSFFPAEWTRLVNGFYLWISPLRAHVPWMYYSFKGSPFDATDGPRLRGGDFAYAVPDPDDPNCMIPTRHWEAFREGIDDLRYLTTLETLAHANPGTDASDAALAWLARLRHQLTPDPAELESIEEESPVLVLLARNLNGSDYRRIRREAAEQILRLTQETTR